MKVDRHILAADSTLSRLLDVFFLVVSAPIYFIEPLASHIGWRGGAVHPLGRRLTCSMTTNYKRYLTN